MLRSSPRGGAGPLAIAVFLVLAGCGPSAEVPDDAVACEGVRCTAGACFSNAGQPMCRCGPWEEAAGLLCQVSSFVVPDDHGGSPGVATVLTASLEPVEGRISASTRGQFDRDLFTFDAEPGHSYVFLCQGLSLPRCQPRLLDASGQQVRNFFQESQRTSWAFKAQARGPWFIEVSGEGSQGTYAYQLVDLGPDDHGDFPEQAGGVEPSEASFTVTSTFMGDSDVIRFQATAGHGYRFGCELPTPGSGVSLRLLEASGRVVGSTDALGSRNRAELDLKAATSGAWFVQVSPTYGPLPMTVQCRLTDLGLDDHGDTPSTATRLTPGVPVSVRMHSRKDVDELVFTASAQHSYVLRQRPSSPALIEFFDPHGVRLDVLRADVILLQEARAGTYHLRVTTPTSQGTADQPFELVLEDLGPDEHGDTEAEATRAAVGTPVELRQHHRLDWDVLAFDVEEAGVYQVTCEPTCQVRIHGPYQGMYVTAGPLRNERLDVSGAGPLYLAVAPASPLTPITLKLTRVAADDHADVLTAHTPWTVLPADLSGQFEARNDREAFAVMLDASRAYVVETSYGAATTFRAPSGEVTTVTTNVFFPRESGRYEMVVAIHEFWAGTWRLRLHPW